MCCEVDLEVIKNVKSKFVDGKAIFYKIVDFEGGSPYRPTDKGIYYKRGLNYPLQSNYQENDVNTHGLHVFVNRSEAEKHLHPIGDTLLEVVCKEEDFVTAGKLMLRAFGDEWHETAIFKCLEIK